MKTTKAIAWSVESRMHQPWETARGRGAAAVREGSKDSGGQGAKLMSPEFFSSVYCFINPG
jgi:hypothetical protein